MNFATKKHLQTLGAMAVLILAVSLPAYAHHILGVPHYNYDEAYPQTPILTMKADVHDFSVEVTGNPGNPQPGERCNLHVYIRDLRTGTPYEGTVTLSVEHERVLIGNELIYGPIEGEIEEAMYKFHPEFDAVGNYVMLASFNARGEEWVVEMPIVVGEPTSPWVIAGSVMGAIVVLSVIARAILIKRKRRAAKTRETVESTDASGPGEQFAK